MAPRAPGACVRECVCVCTRGGRASGRGSDGVGGGRRGTSRGKGEEGGRRGACSEHHHGDAAATTALATEAPDRRALMDLYFS